jgi:hypothetical protein
VAVLSGCDAKTDSDYSDSALDEFSPEIQTLLKIPSVQQVNSGKIIEQNVYQKIDSAMEKGKISKVQAVKLSFIASNSNDKLPKEYQSQIKNSGDSALNDAQYWLTENWNTLTADEKKDLEPFYVPPDSEKSFYHPANQDRVPEFLKNIEIIPGVNAAPDWSVGEAIITESPIRMAFIKYNKDEAGIKQRVGWVNESVFHSWPKIEALMETRPQKSVFIFLVPMSGNALGSAGMRSYEDNITRCTILLKADMDEKSIKSTLTHELFHCFQFAIPLKYDLPPRKWMMEATATWSEHYVWPEYNFEWRFLGSFFNSLDTHMITWNKGHEYSTYAWYIFMTQLKNNPNKVKSDLYAVKTKNAKDVVTSEIGFNDDFAEFAVWNWNQEPKILYRDAPNFPTGNTEKGLMQPNGAAFNKQIISSKSEKSMTGFATGLSAYYDLTAFSSSIEKVVFKFNGPEDLSDKRQALFKIGDQWYFEDWTTLTEKTFCKSRPDQDVEAVVLIFSNAKNTEETESYPYIIDTTGECTPAWRGYMKWSWEKSRSTDFGVADQSYEQSSSLVSNDILVYDMEEDEFYLKEQSVSYKFNEVQDTKYKDSCGVMSHLISTHSQGSTVHQYEGDENDFYNSPAPIRLDGEGDGVYVLDTDIHPGTEWITYSYTRDRKYKDCGFEGSFTPKENKPEDITHDVHQTDTLGHSPNDIKLQMSDDKKKISGTATQDMGNGIVATIEAEYVYG